MPTTYVHRGSNIIEFIKHVKEKRLLHGWPKILSLFRNEFNKFNYIGERLSHDIKIILKSHLWCENVKILPSFTHRYNGPHYVTFCKPIVVNRFYCIALYHSQT